MTTVELLHRDYTNSSALTNFVKVGVLSIVLGLGLGGIVTWTQKKKKFLSINPVLETLYIMVGAYCTYALAHLPIFQLSGDVAIFFYGLMMSHYNKYNMNLETFQNIGYSTAHQNDIEHFDGIGGICLLHIHRLVAHRHSLQVFLPKHLDCTHYPGAPVDCSVYLSCSSRLLLPEGQQGPNFRQRVGLLELQWTH